MTDRREFARDGFTYVIPDEVRPRKVPPPLMVVMNESCTACAGSPSCADPCPVHCIHLVLDQGRPVRVWVDNAACIGCMSCFSHHVRPKDVLKGDSEANCAALNARNPYQKAAICPWDAIEILPFAAAAERSALFYPQPRTCAGRSLSPLRSAP